MANMQATKTPMPEQDPNVRNKNFKEVTLGYTAEMAINEAKRCLQCKKPHCVEGCPVNIHIPEFIHEVAEGNFEKAYEIITDTNALPALSGRVCPQETQCESKCVRGNKGEPVAIGRLERFVADWYRENINAMPKKAESNGIKVAVVGSGPSGLTCASLLAKKGYAVSLFEALHTAGGVLVYGIPEFRLPKAIVANEVEKLKAQGVEVSVVICPGGAYEFCSVREADAPASAFLNMGLQVFILLYSCGEAAGGKQPLTEAAQSVRLVRERADEWWIDPQKILICGFSAGGHLAASLGVHWDDPALAERCGVQDASVLRPDAMVLGYPVITAGQYAHRNSIVNVSRASGEPEQYWSLEENVSEKTPPTFLWHTMTDNSVPVENSLLFVQQLHRYGVACECHLFESGRHGMSVATREVDAASRAGELLIERNEQAPMNEEYPLMAFIANEGVAPKGERYDRSSLVTDTENKLYKRTEFGDFIYSSNNLETGSIGLNKYGKACISPVYSVFHPTGIADSNFLGRRLVRKDFINSMVKWRQGVIYGQWRIHESDFLKIDIPVPSVEEQIQIGTFLDYLDNLITLHQRECFFVNLSLITNALPNQHLYSQVLE